MGGCATFVGLSTHLPISYTMIWLNTFTSGSRCTTLPGVDCTRRQALHRLIGYVHDLGFQKRGFVGMKSDSAPTGETETERRRAGLD